MRQKIPESSVKRAVADYLQILLNQKKICWFTRLNAGAAIVGMKGRTRWINLAPKGSPDFIGFRRDGLGFAVECKGSHGVLSLDQRRTLSHMIEAGVQVFVIGPDNIQTLKELEK